MITDEKDKRSTSEEDSVITITRFFTLPPITVSYLILFITVILLSYTLHITEGLPMSITLSSSFFVLVIPTFISSIVIYLLFSRDKFVLVVSPLLGSLLGVFYLSSHFFESSVVLGYGVMSLLWYVIFYFKFGLRKNALVLTLSLITIYALFMYMDELFKAEDTMSSLAKIYISSVIFLIVAWYLFIIINAPMKRRFGVKTTDAILYFWRQWSLGDKGLEEYFERIGTYVRVPFGIISFKPDKSRRSGTGIKPINLLIPYVHFGPFGNLGGSEFSFMLAESLPGNNIVLHGTVTHDFNPVSSNELSSIVNVYSDMLKEMRYHEPKFDYHRIKKDVNLDVLEFGNCGLVGISFHPGSSEDIELGIGLSIINKLKQIFKTPIVFDEHNSDVGSVKPIRIGEVQHYKLESVVDEWLTSHKRSGNRKLKVGYFHLPIKTDTIGSAGVKGIVFSSDKDYLLIVFDSNGITPETKTYVEQDLLRFGFDSVVIATTDTHENNSVRGVINPLTRKEYLKIRDDLISRVVDAKEHVIPVKVGCGLRWGKVKVLGPSVSTEIITMINSLVSVLIVLIPLLFIITIVMVFFVVSKINI